MKIYDMKEKLSNGLTGIAGEYFVAAELSLRGFMAYLNLLQLNLMIQ